MIRPGRSRRAGPPDLGWHRALARLRSREVRLRRAAAAALAAAAMAALLAVFVPVTAGSAVLAVAVAAVVTATWPVRDAVPWARRFIAARYGLAYDTVLEAEARNDPYGFRAWTREAARARLRDARPPRSEPWWIPTLLAAVLILIALPYLPGSGVGGFPSGSGPAGTSASEGGEPRGPDGAPPAAEAAADARDDGAASPPEERGGEDAPVAPADRDQDAGAPPPEAGDEEGGEGALQGREAVQRFLRESQEAGASEAAEARNPFDPTGPATREDFGGDPVGDVDGAPQQGGAELPLDPTTAGSPQDGREGEDEDAADEAGDDDGAGGGEAPQARAQPQGGDGGDGGEEDGDGETAAGPDGQEPDAAEAPLSEGGEDGGEDGAGGDDQAVGMTEGLLPEEDEAGGEGGEGVDVATDPDTGDGPAPSQGGDAAGAGGAEEGAPEDGGELLTGPNAAPERLRSDPGDGPAPTVGTVRGGGAAPDALPEGEAPSAAAIREAERAIEEGDLPAAYREVLRRYFQ